MVEQILDRVLMGRSGLGCCDQMRFGLPAGLDRDVIVVVVVADGSLGARDDESASGLRLNSPRIGEGAPTGLKLRQPVCVARNNDAMLVHFKTGWFINDGGDFQRTTSVLVPRCKGGSIAEVIEQRTAAMRLLVEPRVWFLRRDLISRFLILVRAMPEWSAIASEMP